MKEQIYSSHRKNYSMILDFGFYDLLTPKMQTELTDQLFGQIINQFSDFFNGCNRSFVNRIVVCLSSKSFFDDQLIQSANAFCHDIYFVVKGGVAVCEPTCYQEPILVYREGAVLNVYQVLLDT